MAKKKKDTTKLSEIEQLENRGLVIRKNGQYYGNIVEDGQPTETALGFSDQELLDNLEQLDKDGIILQPFPDVASNSGQSTNSIDAALGQPIQTESLKDIWQDLISEVSDLSTEDSGGDYQVLIDGVDALRTNDRSLPKDHPVKTCPVVFYWHDKRKNVENGDTITNSGWTVLNKELAKKLGIRTHRDDTPNQNFFTVKSHVLCVARKDQFKRKKAKQALKYKLAAVYEMERRTAAAIDAAKKSKQSIEAAQEIYKADFQTTLREESQVREVSSGGKVSASAFMKQLEDANLEDIEALGNNIDKAISNGDFAGTGAQMALSEADI